MRVIDLFSGLGGFSQAFLDRGHDVLRIDFDDKFREVPNTMVKDIMELEPSELGSFAYDIDIITSSPPCNCFSTLALSTFWENGRPKDPRTIDAIALVKRSITLIERLEPKFWVIENPTGMLRHVIGPPQVLTWWCAWYSNKDPIVHILNGKPKKPTHLWGLLPTIKWPKEPKDCIKAPRGSKTGIQSKNTTPEIRSLIPYNFSLALCKSIESSKGGQISLCRRLSE